VVPPAAPPELAAALLATGVDLVLLDLDLAGYGDSTPVIAPVVAAGIRVLVVTGSAERMSVAAALEQGAFGHHLKSDGFEALVDKAIEALAGTPPLDPEERIVLLDELHRWRAARARALAPFERLTAREADTLRALTRGRSVADIAAEWVVSEATLRCHVRAVLAKLGVGSQLAAVAAALQAGWVQPDPPR
jgi:DNA-binding NarL/FixJ family response regulator